MRVTVFEMTGMPGIVGALSESAEMPVAVAESTLPATQGAATLPNGEPLTTPVLTRHDFRDEPLSYQPLNHDRDGALMRTGQRRHVID